MNIILLSGGSGKRLWPLSNDLRSKQFIKIFKNGSDYESMVQRVYRQIKCVDPNSRITIATSKSQVSAIKNHLGENVSVCIEPCRMDTFPAIALSCFYLHDVLKISSEENIIICPVDPYVDISFFESLKELEILVDSGDTNLSLMGIEPTYPSEKYGYIIPSKSDKVSLVKEFKEKPNVEIAQKYLSQKALWNAGVFGAKLGYLLKKSKRLTSYSSYSDLFENYSNTQKISFDYAVVEKEPSIQVLRYQGEWKDVGTWNMMSEVMPENIKGRGLMDEYCVNTNIVNELNIPVLCMGTHNLIIATSCDGILVADKQRSGYMKPYVNRIETEARFAEKSWGTYSIIDIHSDSLTARISLKAKQRMSYHMHLNRKEIWSIVEGTGVSVIDGIEKNLKVGDVVIIPPNSKHTIIADEKMEIIEIQIGSDISVKDKYKYDFPALDNEM